MESQKRLNGKCVDCGKLHTRLAEGRTSKVNPSAPGLYYYVGDLSVGSSFGKVSMVIRCDCKVNGSHPRVALKAVIGKVTKHLCDTKCQYAESELHMCKCSCGGLNHGMMGFNLPTT